MKLVLRIGALACFLLLSVALWLSAEPTTELKDSTGKPLVAQSTPKAAGGVDAGSLFAPVRRKLDAARFADAKADLLRILEQEEFDGLACTLLSRACRELRQVDAAVDYGLKAVHLLPDNAPAHLAYARALGVQLMSSFEGVGGLFKALPRIKRFKAELALVVQFDPMDTEARTMQVFAAMAPVVGDADYALQVAEELVEIEPQLGNKMLAYAFSNKGEEEQAMAVCKAAKGDFPGDNGFSLILAGLYRDAGRAQEARVEYALVRSIGPRNEDYYLSMSKQAEMQLDHGLELDEARGLMEEFLAAHPTGDWIPPRADAQFLLGAILLKLDQVDSARAAFEDSLRLEPGHKRSTKALAALE